MTAYYNSTVFYSMNGCINGYELNVLKETLATVQIQRTCLQIGLMKFLNCIQHSVIAWPGQIIRAWRGV